MTDEPPQKKVKVEMTPIDQVQTDEDINDEIPENIDRPEAFKRLTEEECGIVTFVNQDLPRFSCLLKELTSDFQVFEVTAAGEVLKLKNVPREEELQKERQEVKAQQTEVESKIETQNFDYESEAAHNLKDLVGEEVFDKIKNLLRYSNEWQGEGANAPLPVLTPVIDDRDKRTKIHKALREVFLGSLDSEARDDKKMRISAKQRRQGGRGKSSAGRGRGGRDRGTEDRRQAWTQPGDYTIFTVYKDGRDTMDVASTLSRVLRVPPKIFGYAGTKDKRGCTVQNFSAYRLQHNKLATLNVNGAFKNVTFGDFRYASKGLTLGDLKGNKFVLVLRDIQGSTDSEIDQAFSLIKEKGFVNYYGLQRFGTSSVGTQQVGIHVLRGEYKEACNTILEEHAAAWRETKEAKLHWIKTRDPTKTLEMMPSKCVAETAMLKCMVKSEQKNDWTGAFNSIPRNLRLIYMHAYQSLVWNNVVTSRLQRYGMSPVEGDLVIDNQASAQVVTDKNDKIITKARAITADEIDKFTIYDIVLPLPGCDVTYPDNDIRSVYSTFMQREQLDPFDMVRSSRETSLLGSYRKIMSRPIDLQWEILKYDDARRNDQLVATNLDELEGRSITLPSAGAHTAVRLEFQLESAAYATMLLREALSSVPYSI